MCLRRGILLLTELNCIVLGGDDDLLMKTGRPVETMMKCLNISPQRQSFISLSKAEKEINQLVFLSNSFLFKKFITKFLIFQTSVSCIFLASLKEKT